MMNTEDLIKKCADKLISLCDKVAALNSLNYYDINTSCEYFYMHLLNMVYGWHLKNINDITNNAAGIDLFDEKNKIAVQVTSNDSANKIHDTIKKHIEQEYYQKYNHLVVLLIKYKKTYSANFVKDTENKFVFDKDKDIITCGKLIKDIRSLDWHKIQEISDFLEFELGTILDKNHVWNIEQVNSYISNFTNNILNLDYFEVDDKNFQEDFEKQLENNKCIHINGFSKEETLYCVINQIKNMKLSTPVYIIKDVETWSHINENITDSVLIPYFNADEIPPINKNINIFIYGIDRPCTNRRKIKLHRRTIRFLEEKLRNRGYEEPYKLLDKTNGIFAFIKRELFGGQPEDPDWIKSKDRAFLVALLFGKWTKTNGDSELIQELSSMPYNEFLELICAYSKASKPFIVIKNSFDKIIYQLSDTQLAWAFIGEEIPDKLKSDFISLSEKVITEKDPLFNQPFDTHFQASVRSEKPKYSNEIKHGIIRSLIFLSINGYQAEVDTCIKKILATVKSVYDWGYISQFFEELCEASPSVIITRLESEIDNNTGLLEMFTVESEYSIGSRHYYTHILWAAEQFLSIKQYASRITHWLMALGNIIIECSTGNSPRGMVSDIFCTWHNISVLSPDDKIQLAETGIKKYTYMWDIIFDQLPGNHQTIMTTNVKFDFIESDEILDFTDGDISKLNFQYFELLTQHIKNDVNKWNKIFNVFQILPDDLFSNLIFKLKQVVTSLNDKELEQIKTSLRKLIHRHRYFATAFWAMDESRIIKIEELCKSITFEDQIYDFLYLALPTYNLPLFYPTAFEKEDNVNGRDENEIKNQELLMSEFSRFKKLGLNLEQMYELINTENSQEFGRNIAMYYSEKKFDKQLLCEMLKTPKMINIIVDYVCWCYFNDSKD